MSDSPRVFISYARKDGEAFATALRSRLEREEREITLWQDRARMEGGVGWWKQITDALDVVQFMVLVMTPASMKSPIVRQEWRYARQQGVCVYPVKGAPDAELDYGSLPRWMSSAHFYDLDHEWETFVNYLKSPCRAVRVPFMARDLPAGFVERSAEMDQLLGHVLDAGRQNPVATTVALFGAGGFGKTTLAEHLCHHEDVITAYHDGILWATLGEKPNILAELTRIYAALTGERLQFVNAEDAALELAKRLADRNFLIVVDDVWDTSHLEPFLRGGETCTRLITTRQFEVATRAGARVRVDEMKPAEAARLLVGYLEVPPQDVGPFRALAHRLGEWPLLLELAGGALRQRMARGDTLDGAVAYLNLALDKKGVGAFDKRNATERHQAIANTVAVSLDLLDDEERRRYCALAVFPEDTDVPLTVVSALSGLDDFDTEALVQRFDDLSLLRYTLKAGTIRLHDVMRAYLAAQLEDPAALHARLADAWSTPEDLPDAYAWRWAVYHGAAAMQGRDPQERHRRTHRLVDLASRPDFRRGHQQHVADPPALQDDLERVLQCAVQDEDAAAPALVLRAALALAAFQGEQLRPEALFDLAREGKLQEAEKRLDLFHPDTAWRQAVLLTLAWLAAREHPAEAAGTEAAALCDRLAGELYDARLKLLLQRLQADTRAGVPEPPLSLPAPPDLFMVTQILDRMGGSGATVIEPLIMSGLQAMGDEAPLYLAEQDGPMLVAFAAEHPGENTKYVKQYIAVNASNNYEYYRNRSLWALMPAVLQHPDPAWVVEMLQELEVGALTQSRIDFRVALPLTVRALRAAGGDADALQALEQERARTLTDVANLSPGRGESDPWAHHLRRLTALAEVYARILGRTAEAAELLGRALALPFQFNFAGFRAPACLTLAEAVLVGNPADRKGVDDALEAALQAAHNIQDAAFCARMTARVNAMKVRWWPAPPEHLDVAATIPHFAQDPSGPAFSALHRTGETYRHRFDNPNKLPLPDLMRRARTLDEIAAVYPGIHADDAAEIRRLNPDLHGPPSDGTYVHIADPDFAPLLAARLAAEALALPEDGTRRRVTLIQQLVPVAAANLTALDTVLARLLMAARPSEAAMLQRLEEALR